MYSIWRDDRLKNNLRTNHTTVKRICNYMGACGAQQVSDINYLYHVGFLCSIMKTRYITKRTYTKLI